jgi:glycolate oxidase FAD binding subunit
LPIVSEPSTLEEAAEALGSGQRVSIERDGGEVRLSTAKLARVLEHEPGDLTMIVEAGIRLSALQGYLAEHGQMLSLDPPGDPTVGACLAGDLSGPRRHRYGAMRDLVLGVTVVLAGGMVASSGGKVVKNVAGYDLGKLFSGSHGRLGLVARVALRLHPRPPAQATVVATGDPRSLWAELRASQLEPSAADVLPPGRLALLFEGGQAAVEAQVAACPGELADAEIWEESARLQAAAGGREGFAWQECVLARPGPGIAFVSRPAESAWPPLAERVRASFDPEGMLA